MMKVSVNRQGGRTTRQIAAAIDVLTKGGSKFVYYLGYSKTLGSTVMQKAMDEIDRRGLTCNLIKQDKTLYIPFLDARFIMVSVESGPCALEGTRHPLFVDHYAWEMMEPAARRRIEACPMKLDKYGLEQPWSGEGMKATPRASCKGV